MDERANAEWVASAGPAPGVAARSSKSASKRAGTIGPRSESRAGHSRRSETPARRYVSFVEDFKECDFHRLACLALKLRCFSSCPFSCTCSCRPRGPFFSFSPKQSCSLRCEDSAKWTQWKWKDSATWRNLCDAEAGKTLGDGDILLYPEKMASQADVLYTFAI